MNLYAWIIFSTLVAGFLLDALATVLNMYSTPKILPAPFQGWIDEERFQHSRAYLRARGTLSLIGATLDLTLLLLWWRFGGFNILDQWLRTWVQNDISRGLLFIGMLLLASRILSLPISIYGVFVVEEFFGFNKTTPTTFILDLIKSTILAVLLGGAILWGILWFFYQVGPWAWLYCWAGTTAFSVALQYLAPKWLFPLFNTFKPLPEGDLKRALLDYATQVNFQVRDIFEVDGSKRSTKANAFFTGFGKNRRIALFDTLIKSHSQEELVAVLAHEVGHFKEGHLLKNLGIGTLHMGLLFYLMSLFLAKPELFQAFQMQEVSIYAGLVFFSFLLSPLDLLLGPALKWYSRHNEYQADRFAVHTAPHPDALVDALKKLAVNSLSNLTPHPFYVMLHDTHPPLAQRIGGIHTELAFRSGRSNA